jgi:hypothetical protein
MSITKTTPRYIVRITPAQKPSAGGFWKIYILKTVKDI